MKQPSDWIEWNGGAGSPVPDSQHVEARLRSGEIIEWIAGELRWYHAEAADQDDADERDIAKQLRDHDAEIVAYRVPVAPQIVVLENAVRELKFLANKHFLWAAQSMSLTGSTKDLKLSILADEVVDKLSRIIDEITA